MRILDLFKSKASTTDALKNRWDQTQAILAELGDREKAIKKEVLSGDGDSKSLLDELSQVRLEMEFSEIAKEEIRTQMDQLLSDKIKADHDKLRPSRPNMMNN